VIAFGDRFYHRGVPLGFTMFCDVISAVTWFIFRVLQLCLLLGFTIVLKPGWIFSYRFYRKSCRETKGTTRS
jgi:hypothetical protein